MFKNIKKNLNFNSILMTTGYKLGLPNETAVIHIHDGCLTRINTCTKSVLCKDNKTQLVKAFLHSQKTGVPLQPAPLLSTSR